MANFSSALILLFVFITSNNNNTLCSVSLYSLKKVFAFVFVLVVFNRFYSFLVSVFRTRRQHCCFRHRIHFTEQLSVHNLARNPLRQQQHPRRRRISLDSRRFQTANRSSRMVRPVLASHRLQLRFLRQRQLRHLRLRRRPQMHRRRSSSDNSSRVHRRNGRFRQGLLRRESRRRLQRRDGDKTARRLRRLQVRRLRRRRQRGLS